MAKQLNVNLAFTANTSEAKRQLQDLQLQLSQLANTPVSLKGKGITKEIIEASNAAAELKVHLDKATNVQTGNLDFTKLSQSIKNSGSSLAEYGEKLKSLGPAGNTAFQALAQSVAKAEIPIRRSNAALTEMWTTLKNTARWQVSSSILHGFMGAVQSAYGYAQDLNSSLNNIRIVTGQNTEQMARFAEEANKAARALSATTTDYTNASLIYYQQGLSDSEVAQRTEVTIKMANAAGVSAEKVSDQLTAVWNNFYDGSKSLEYYADVMTALGAATASSTDEISDGLNKFAAVAETVGLSYEYATSALATVTATTRESADVVGTAFKTLFARIQGLTLGETLEDGTDLNKYSEALYKVGIDIKDTNGNMKDMDAILNELGAKWQTLGKDQQTALAQTVAGVRQYTQLVALMDNWDYFQENLGVATGATGALQEQADIYAESWEAAQKRVTAAAEAIYSDLLNDDFFIDVLNGFEKFLGLIDHLLDSMGGVQGALAGISALVLKLFSNQISQGITNMAYNMKMMTESGRQAVQDEQKAFIADAADSLNPSMDSTIEGQTRSESLKTQLGLQVSMIENIDKMSEAEKEVNQMYMDRLRMMGEESALKAKAVDEAQEKTSQASLNVRAEALENVRNWTSDEDEEYRKQQVKETNEKVNQANINTKTNIGIENIIKKQSKQIRKDGKVSEKALEAITKAIEDLKKKGSTAFDEILKDMPEVGDSAEIVEDKLRKMEQAAESAVDELAERDYNNAGVLEAESIEALTDAYREEIQVTNEANEAKEAESKIAEDLENKILNAEGSQKKWSDTLVASAQSVSTMVMGLSSLGAAWDALTNPDLSGWEKFVSVSTSLAMGLPAVISGMTGLNNVLNLTNAARMVSIMRLGEESKAQAANTLAKVLGISTETALAVVTEALTLGKGKLTLANLMEAASNNGVTISKGLETAATIAQTVANWGLLASMPPLLAIMLVLVAVIGGLALIIWGIVSAANALSDAYNADAIAAENAEKGAKNLADAYNGVKQEYEDMIASMENYKSARDALDNLTEGTKEYDAALKEANRAAMELVNQYGLIEGQDYEWQGDELVVKDEAMDRVSAAKEAEADEAYAASQMANANAKALRAQSNLTDARREIRDDNGLGDGDRAWLGVANGISAALGIALAPVTGGLSLAATALAAGSSINADMQAAEMDAAINKAVEEARDNQNLFDTKEAMAEALNIDLNDTDLIDALWANQEEIQSLANEMNAAEAAWKVAAQNSANEILNNNKIVQNSENTEDVMAAGGNMYSIAYEDAYDKYLADAKDRGLFNTGTDASKKAFEDYAEKAGLNDLKNFKVTNYKGDGTVEYKYIDDQGQEQKVIATAEEIAATLAAAEAAEKLGASAENLIDVFDRLDESGNAYDQAMKNFLSTGDFENSTREESLGLYEQVANANPEGVMGGEASKADVGWYLDKQFGDGKDGMISDDTAKQYGYESAQAMIDAFYEEIQDINEAWESIELPSELKGLDNMSLQTAQAFENTIENLNLGPAGEKAGEKYVAGINDMVAGLSEEDQVKALEQLANIDWTSLDAMNQASLIMEEFGVSINLADEKWVKLGDTIRRATLSFPQYDDLKTTIQEITGIVKDLDFGSAITDEDYDKLISYNAALKELFMLQADGTRVFIGDNKAIQESTRQNLLAMREDLKLREQRAKAVKEEGATYSFSAMDIDKRWGDGKDGKLSTTNSGLINYWNGKGENLNSFTSSEQAMDYAIAAEGQKAWESEAIQAILANQGYTADRWTELIEAAKDGNTEGLQAALDFVSQSVNEDFIQADLEIDEMVASTATSLSELNALLANDEIGQEAWQKQASYLEAAAAQNATTLAELDAVVSEYGLNNMDESYVQNLMRIAEGYESCADELKDYQAALSAFDPGTEKGKEAIAQAEDSLRAQIALEDSAKKYGLEVESLTAQSKRLAKAYGLTAEEAADLAVRNQRMNKGVSSLNENWDDWKKQLKSSNKLTEDYADAVVDCTSAIADLVGACDDLELPDEFFNDENFALIEKAMKGDVAAINQLGAAVGAATVKGLEFNEAFASLATDTWLENDLEVDVTLDHEQFDLDREAVLAGINAIKNGTLTAGEAMDGEWVAALNRMALATGMSVDEMNGLLGSLGVQAKVETSYVKQPMELPTYTEKVTNLSYRPIPTTKYDENGEVIGTYNQMVPEYTTASVPGPPIQTEGYVAVAQISTEDNPMTLDVSSNTVEGGSKPAASYSGKRGPVAPSATVPKDTGGGKDDEPTPAEKQKVSKKSDFGERYHTINKQLENTSREMEKASKAADKLWSKDRLEYLDEQNAKLDEEIELLQEKTRQAEDYLKDDKTDLDATARDLGFIISYGENKEILNYDDIRDWYAQEMIDAQNELNNFATKEEQDAYQETIIDPLQEKIDAFEAAASLYYDTLGVIQENEDKIQDNLDQKMQNNFDKWSGMLELDIKVNERDLEILDYYLSKIEDDVYSMAEAAALMVGSLHELQSGKMGGQLGEYLDNLNIYNDAMNDLNIKLASGAITEAAYEEGLESIRSGLLDNLQSINELDNAMLNYYSDTLSMVTEEIDKYSTKMEHQTSILEHYANMMDILGKSQDYETMGTILQGQVDNLQNELDVAEAEYNLYAEEAEKKRQLYENALASNDQVAADVYKNEWEAAEEAAMEAQDNMLSKTEEWAEAMKAVVENKLSGLAKSLEEALTGGTSFDELNTSMSRAASLQEEYLTTTNQIYETNKLMRTAQQEIDKSTNTVAKQRLKDFIKETDQLQDKSKLSKYELEIQQAKYDLLLAEIALEEAQNAKSTVRLQRDSEGNFGYVYTADQNQMTAAQQQLEDAQNNLYNIGLEGANGYAEKYSQTMQEMYDTLTSITEAYYNGEIGSQEEYERQMLAAQEYYYEQLENYQDLYGIALSADTRVIKDAWSSGFNDMINNTSKWKDKVKIYSDEAAQTLVGWHDQVDKIAAKTGLDNIASKVKNVTDESKKLKEMILGTGGEDTGVIGALAAELTAVGNLTGGYANLRTTIQGVITDYEKLLEAVNKAQNSEQAVDTTVTGNDDNGNSDSGDNTSNGQGGSPTGGDSTSEQEKHKDSTLTTGTSVTVKTTATHFSRDGGNGTKMRSFVPGGTYSVFKVEGNEVLIGRGNVATGWVKKTDLVGFDTGGYTGSWGSYGKMAMLHEKELVLNKEDTSNFLASMEVLERILEVIDLQSMNAQLGGLLSTPSFGNNDMSQTVEQNVRIEASFPAVTDRNEIEEAFNTLINTASQYANRR